MHSTWPFVVGSLALLLLSVAAPSTFVLLAIDQTPLPVPSSLPVVEVGASLPGQPTPASFHGRPQGTDAPTCQAAWNPDYLAPSLRYDEAANRSTPLNLALRLDPGLPHLDWSLVAYLAQRYYGVNLTFTPGGIPIQFIASTDSTYDRLGLMVAAELDTGRLLARTVTGATLLLQGPYTVLLHSNLTPELSLAHEFGHALGLTHVRAWGNLMNPVLSRAGFALQDCQRFYLSHIVSR